LRKIIITGGCGFIGSNLANYLGSQSKYDITIIDNLSSGNKKYIQKKASYKIINADIAKKESIVDHFGKCELVIHLAASGSVIDSVNNPRANFINNVLGTFNVLEGCRINNVKKLIYASTGGAIAGNAKLPINEKSFLSPISPYGSSKLCGESYCSSYSSSYNMDITALRFSNIVGPNSFHKKGIIQKLFLAILLNKKINIYGDGSSSRDYLHVGDLCNAISTLIEKDYKNFNIFHLSSGIETTINELIEKVKINCKVENILCNYDKQRIGEVYKTFASNEHAKKALDFKLNYSLDDAIKDAWISYKKDFNQIKK